MFPRITNFKYSKLKIKVRKFQSWNFSIIVRGHAHVHLYVSLICLSHSSLLVLSRSLRLCLVSFLLRVKMVSFDDKETNTRRCVLLTTWLKPKYCFKKLVMTLKNVKNTHNLIKWFLFLKSKNWVKIVIQQNSKTRNYQRNFFPKN